MVSRCVQGLRENQRNHFHTDLRDFGREEPDEELNLESSRWKDFLRRSNRFSSGEAHVAELHFAAERGGSFFFDGGTELVDGIKTAR